MSAFVLRQSHSKYSAFLWGHVKPIVPIHDLVQSERLGFHATVFVNLLPMQRLTVSWAVFYNFTTTAPTHLVWKYFCAICAAIVSRVRSVVLTHHAWQSFDYRRVHPFKVSRRAFGIPFFSGKGLRVVENQIMVSNENRRSNREKNGELRRRHSAKRTNNTKNHIETKQNHF